MFRRKVEYEDEKMPIPVIWTVVIAIVVVAGMVFGTCKMLDAIEKHEMELQYEYYYDGKNS